MPDSDTILDEAKALVYGDRGEAYGHPLDDWTRVAGMFNALFADKLKESFTAEEMLEVPKLMKTSRRRVGWKRDHLVDDAGYTFCIDRCHSERQRRSSDG